MNIKGFAVVLCVVILPLSGPAHAAELRAVVEMPELSAAAEKIIVAEGDILNRPYRVLGQVFVRVKKVGVFDRPPIEEKTDILLKAEAAKLGADAVINVRRERDGITVFNFGYMNGIGTAVVFDNEAVDSTPQRRLAAPPSVPTPPSNSLPSADAAPSVSSPSPQSPPRVPLVSDPSEKLMAFLSAINRADAEAAANLFATDGIIEDPAGSQPLVGRAAIDSYLRALVGRGARYELVMQVGNAGTRTAAMSIRVTVNGASENIIQTFAFRTDGSISKLSIYRAALR